MIRTEATTTVAVKASELKSWNRYLNDILASEISCITKYYDTLIQWRPREGDTGYLLERVECRSKATIGEFEEFPDLTHERDRRTAVLLNGTFNHHYDIQHLLQELKSKLSRNSRLVVNCYNPYLSFLYRWANRMGLRKGEQPSTFVTKTDVKNLASLSGFEVVRVLPAAYCPWSLFGLGTLINRVLAAFPVVRWFSFAQLIILRPVISEGNMKPSLTVVIPARNEKGNIEAALQRMPNLDGALEIIFVEGHSSDGTWEEIQRVARKYSDKFNLKAFRQTGKGKSDAVRLGFSKATCDLLTILDADLTMPPELLGRFYDAYRLGLADFVNGTRLVYPMEGDAMRPLNRLGNIFFAKALSWVLGTQLGDSLCGTKLLARHDYSRMIAWRNDFGDVDPFGDFELLFPASTLALGIIDIPVRYRARTYGSTNISRFRHGFMLLKMTLTGFFKIRMGRGRSHG